MTRTEGAAADRSSPQDHGGAADIREVGRGGVLNLAGVVTSTFLSFLLVVIVTRGLGATATGLFFEALALFNILATIAIWGAEVGIVRAIPRYRVQGRPDDVLHVIVAAIVPAVALACGLGLALALFATPLGGAVTNGAHGHDLAPMLVALAPFLPVFAAYTVTLAATRGFGTMVPTNIVDKLGRAALQPLLALLAVTAGLSGVALAVAWASPFVAVLVGAGVWLLVLWRSLDHDVTAEPGMASLGRRGVVREFWRFTAPRGLATLFAVAVLWLSTLLVGAFRSVAEAGVYAAATRYLVFGQFIGVAISQVVGPKLSEVLAAGDRDRARSVYAAATWWLMVLAWPLYVSMITLAPALLSIFGPGYGEAVPVLVIMGATMLVATAVGPVDMVLLMAGRSTWNLGNTFVAAGANVILNIVLIPRFGMVGAAIAWSVSVLINNVFPLVQVWWAFGLEPFGVGTIVAGGAASVCFGGSALAIRALSGSLDLMSLIVCASIATPPYLYLVWRFRSTLHLDWMGEVLRGRASAASGTI